ncbi:MAG: magnesium and cobalt transport protein CorA [Spirochaetae bacterium HGW-Spirochaetae-1]|jgi:magnesium transporter|nr:MAG: magnesium and cobalt transport protein CorA [Spirochaetae bacterium HGW-Spirochaetae-1]
MLNLLKGRKGKIGLPAGTLLHVGEQKAAEVRITLIDYNQNDLHEQEISDVRDCIPFLKTEGITWINVCGLHDTTVIESIGNIFGLHPLILEDILNTNHRPKIEDYDDYIFTVLKMIDYDMEKDEIQIEQYSIILGSNFIITFQEQSGGVFNIIWDRVRSSKGRLRKMGLDYLHYSLLDVIVDHNFLLLEKIGERIEDIEEELTTDPTPTTLQSIHRLKREMIYLRRSVWPLREIIGFLQRTESHLISDSVMPYLRDVYDHTVQVIDTIETFRDMISNMLDIYLSSMSNRMNEVMKVLTIISTTFIPLTFIAGVYGMNFKFMPELETPLGYPVIMGIMFFIGIGMVIYFRRKNWL